MDDTITLIASKDSQAFIETSMLLDVLVAELRMDGIFVLFM